MDSASRADVFKLRLRVPKPQRQVLIHGDQGSQYGSHDYLDNAVAESFFATLKKDKIRQRIFATRAAARKEIFEFIELFYNPKKRHSHIGGVSPEQFEANYFSKQSGV